ncbi:MAG: aldo/keto reductase [Candidatus Solibacter sp.]|nr:aldo/keto reductase [Candidatus Solibacter sp.]
MIEFGLGTIGIGKPWGFANPEVPDERHAQELLERAFTLGVRYFDTAPSYGVSEQRIATFLAGLPTADRAEPYVDHGFGELRRSLDGSTERLGRIDFLQLHKTTPAVLRSDDLARAWEYAASLGIRGAGDREPRIPGRPTAVQRRAGNVRGCDRPFGMGRMLYENRELTKADAFAFILRMKFDGVILSGTKSPDHLEENYRAFEKAKCQG